MTYNEETMELKLKRIEVCDLLIACTSAAHRTDAKKWKELHRKLKEMIDDFDNKNFIETT